MRSEWDDEDLLAALRAATSARAEVPPEHVTAVKDAYTWHTIDAELAQLTFDSSWEPGAVAVTRSEPAFVRALTFTSAHLTIEVEVTEDALIGQVVPAQEGTVELQAGDGVTTTAPVDRIGCFRAEPIPAGPFQLRYRNRAGPDVVTNSITL